MKKIFLLLIGIAWGGWMLAQRSYVVDQQHPQAGDEQAGTAEAPFKTISRAANLARPGDTVLVKTGVYRERVTPARGGEADRHIVYRAAPGEQVVVKATEPWQPDWQPVAGHPQVFYGSFSQVDFALKPAPPTEQFPGAPTHYNPFLDTLEETPGGQELSLGQIFVDGIPLLEVSDSLTLLRRPGAWRLDAARKGAYVHVQASQLALADRQVELTTRRRCFAPYRRGLGYIEVYGFTFEGGATNFPRGFWASEGHPQAGIVSTRGGHHWRIQGCTIRHAKSIGLDIGNEGPNDADGLGQARQTNAGHHLILGNTISDNGCGGIEGIGSTATRIIGNRIERNNRLGFTAPEIGGIKLHVFENGLIADNLIQDNYAYGLWLDNIWHHSRVTRNVIIGNQGTNLFIELGQGPLLIDHNVIALSHNNMALNGDGVYSHDASGVTFAHNLVFGNANFGLWVHVATDRMVYQAEDGLETETKVPCQASRWRVYQNLFWSNHGGTLAFPAASPRSQDNRADYNHLAGPFAPLTSETSAEGLGEPWFRLLPNKGRVAADSLYSALYAQLGTPARPVPAFSLDEWTRLTGWEAHSLHGLVLRPALLQGNLQFYCMVGQEMSQLTSSPLSGFKQDFFGHEMPEAALPGPFQQVALLPELQPQPVPFRGPYAHVKPGLFPENVFQLGHWPKAYPLGYQPDDQAYFEAISPR